MNNQHGHHPGDKDLVRRILAGDDAAFRELVNNTRNLVNQIIFKMIPVAEDRKDMAQDVYMKVFHKIEGFKFQSKLSTWTAQIAYNTCLNYLDKKKLILPGDVYHADGGIAEHTATYPGYTTVNDAGQWLSQKELSGILNETIKKLPPVYQTLVTLFHHEGIDYNEMAEITGLPGGTVKSYLFRARKMMKGYLLDLYKKEEL